MRFPRSGLRRAYTGLRSTARSRKLTGPRGWAAAAGAALALALAGFLMASIVPGPGARAIASGPGSVRRAGAARLAVTPAAAAGAGLGSSRVSMAGADRTVTRAAGARAAVRPTATAATGAPRTSCRSVAHIGDSTSVDLISPANLPDPAQQLPARYAGVGVRHLLMDASGGRSIVEALPRQVNGYNVARDWWNQGYRGCWVFALGTNDAANVSVGSSVGLTGRINGMMSAAHGEPVLWVNTVTRTGSGPWSEVNEQLWDTALAGALARYPNMRILDWAALARPGWFLPDGIHYDYLGCVERARAIAVGLARAFPLQGHSPGRIVR